MARKVKSEQAPYRAPYRPEHVNSDDTVPDNTDFIMEIDETNEAVTGNGLKILGSGIEPLIHEVQKLRHLGIEDLGLPLPKIIVVGDQSTGKSSLIEGMSEIKVPRATGTCTRCPMEINLTQNTSHTWRCHVMIHKKFTYSGRFKIDGPTKARPLGPWDRQYASEDFNFAIIDSALEVPRVLEWAQSAVLNPKDSYEAYAQGYASGGKPTQQHTVKFSPNVVRLDISGCDLPNLSFFDLPGVINVADASEDNYLVDLVKNLVKEYVTAKDCINLLAIPMTDDPANSSASKLLRDLKVDSKTIGCLTKPDRVTDDEMAQWIQILKGESFQLGHGYYVIKNNKDHRVDHMTARHEEADFFQGEPWTSNDLQPYHEQFGTPKLQAALSELLAEQIKQSLPDFATKVKDKAALIQIELDSLPEVIQGNITATIMDEIGKFSNELQKHIDGGSQDCPFQKLFYELATSFRKTLGDSKPKAILRESSRPLATRETPTSTSTPTPRSGAAAITIDSDPEDEFCSTPTPMIYRSGNGKKRPLNTPENSPNKTRRTEKSLPYSVGRLPQPTFFTLPEIRQVIHRGYISLPGQVDPKAIEELIRQSMAHWGDVTRTFLARTKELCQNAVSEQVQKAFRHRQDTTYYNEILNICDEFLEEILARYGDQAVRMLDWELAKPKTLNERAMGVARQEALDLLTLERRKVLATPYLEELERKTNKQSDLSRDERLAKVPNERLAPETYGPELNAIAETKAYYDVAYCRFMDNLCLSIHSEVFIRCREELVPHLKHKIGILEPDAHDRLAVLLAIPPQLAERRAILIKEKATITQALQQLEALHK